MPPVNLKGENRFQVNVRVDVDRVRVDVIANPPQAGVSISKISFTQVGLRSISLTNVPYPIPIDWFIHIYYYITVNAYMDGGEY
jgi:hypothetical protein